MNTGFSLGSFWWGGDFSAFYGCMSKDELLTNMLQDQRVYLNKKITQKIPKFGGGTTSLVGGATFRGITPVPPLGRTLE